MPDDRGADRGHDISGGALAEALPRPASVCASTETGSEWEGVAGALMVARLELIWHMPTVATNGMSWPSLLAVRRQPPPPPPDAPRMLPCANPAEARALPCRRGSDSGTNIRCSRSVRSDGAAVSALLSAAMPVAAVPALADPSDDRFARTPFATDVSKSLLPVDGVDMLRGNSLTHCRPRGVHGD
jgi:hypothetical protein